MGKIKRGILGGFSGKVANVIGGSWKGIGYMRSQPLSVANPNTAAQVEQRTAFSNAVALGKVLLVSIIKPLWDRFAQQMSGYNAWMQANINLAISDAGINFNDLILSRGVLTPSAGLAMIGVDGAPGVDFSWDNNTGQGTALGTDIVFLAVFNEDSEEWAFNGPGVVRTSLTAQVDTASNQTTGDTLHGYICFKAADGTRVSNSDYVTSVVPA